MDLRMQRLDPPIHHLRQAGDLGDVDHLDAGLAQQLGRAAGRDDVDAVPAQGAGKIGKAGLVADGKQRAGNLASRHAVRLRRARLRWDRPDCPPPPPSVTRSMFQTIRTSLASPIMPPSTTCEVGLRPARVGEEEALLDLGLRRVGADLPGLAVLQLEQGALPVGAKLHAHGRMQMEADGVFAGDQPRPGSAGRRAPTACPRSRSAARSARPGIAARGSRRNRSCSRHASL